MPSATQQYNETILSVGCPHCGAKPRERCRPGGDSIMKLSYKKVTPPHKVRVQAVQEIQEQ